MKAKISDFACVLEYFDTSVPPPSPPRDTFHDDEATKVLDDMDRAIIPSIIPDEEANDERIIPSKHFISNYNFVNTPGFKSFWLREKLKNLSDEEIRNFYKDSIRCTPKEGREMLAKSDMLLVPGWDLEKIFLLDQIMRQKGPLFSKELGKPGLGVYLSLKAFIVWAKASNNQKPLVLQGIEHKRGDVVVRTLEDTTTS